MLLLITVRLEGQNGKLIDESVMIYTTQNAVLIDLDFILDIISVV